MLNLGDWKSSAGKAALVGWEPVTYPRSASQPFAAQQCVLDGCPHWASQNWPHSHRRSSREKGHASPTSLPKRQGERTSARVILGLVSTRDLISHHSSRAGRQRGEKREEWGKGFGCRQSLQTVLLSTEGLLCSTQAFPPSWSPAPQLFICFPQAHKLFPPSWSLGK